MLHQAARVPIEEEAAVVAVPAAVLGEEGGVPGRGIVPAGMVFFFSFEGKKKEKGEFPPPPLCVKFFVEKTQKPEKKKRKTHPASCGAPWPHAGSPAAKAALASDRFMCAS